MNKEIDIKIRNSVQSLIDIWTMNLDGDVPICFKDNLAYVFFLSDLICLCRFFYKLGKKEQKRKYKHRAVKRWKEKNESL